MRFSRTVFQHNSIGNACIVPQWTIELYNMCLGCCIQMRKGSGVAQRCSDLYKTLGKKLLMVFSVFFVGLELWLLIDLFLALTLRGRTGTVSLSITTSWKLNSKWFTVCHCGGCWSHCTENKTRDYRVDICCFGPLRTIYPSQWPHSSFHLETHTAATLSL